MTLVDLESEVNFYSIAQKWVEDGWVVVPSTVIWSDNRYKKIIAYLDQGNTITLKKSISDFTIEDFKSDGSKWFESTRGFGVLCSENQANNGTWLIKIDLDCKNRDEAESRDLKLKLYERFKSHNCSIFGTVSDGLGVIIKTDFYVPHGEKIWFDGVLIGNTSDYNVLPPTEGYGWIVEKDLEVVWTKENLSDCGILFGRLDRVKADKIDNAVLGYELSRYQRGLALLGLAYHFGMFGEEVEGRIVGGYDDSYSQWIRLLLIGRSLGDGAKEIFHQFSKEVGGDRYNSEIIEEEWSREDKGGLGIATLEEWVKSVWENTRLRPLLNQDQIQEFREYVNPTKSVAELVKYFERAYASRVISKRLEHQILIDACVSQNISFDVGFRQYTVWSKAQSYFIEKNGRIPNWEIEDEKIVEILERLPGGGILRQYAEDRRLNAAIIVPLYLAAVTSMVSKGYKRLTSNGKSIHGSINVFLIGDSGMGKSLYTGLVDCLGTLQEVFDKEYKAKRKIYDFQLNALKKKKDVTYSELPEEPPHTQVRLTNFTYPAIIDCQRSSNCGVMIALDEASTIFSADVSGMRMNLENILANFAKIWNGVGESERRRSLGVTFSVSVKASIVAGLQTKHLKTYLRNDPNGFFGRCHLISVDSVKEGDSEITEPMIKNELCKVFTQVLSTYKAFDPDYVGLNELSGYQGLAYPKSSIVDQYLDEVYEITEKLKNSRLKYVLKVRDNFWRIVQALEVLNTAYGVTIDWEQLYKIAITISKWLCQTYEETMVLVSSYEENSDENVDLKSVCWDAVYRFYMVPKNQSRPWSDCYRTILKRQMFKGLDVATMNQWKDEWLEKGLLKKTENGFRV